MKNTGKNDRPNEKTGILYLVATPIGNLEDITYRAVRILGEVGLIAAEDTRTSKKLLDHYDIHTEMTSYHEHNKLTKAPFLLQTLAEGTDVAVITDAGTPGISDPGEELVAMALEAGHLVYALPGPAAFVAAATTSGLPCRRIAFEAFLPKNKKLRKKVLESLKTETRTILLYEAPHHLRGTLRELLDALGDRRAVLCRELTKRFEDKTSGLLSEHIARFEKEDPRGEYVVVLEGRTFSDIENEGFDKIKHIPLQHHYQQKLDMGLDRKEAMKAVAAERGMTKNEVYKALHQ